MRYHAQGDDGNDTCPGKSDQYPPLRCIVNEFRRRRPQARTASDGRVPQLLTPECLYQSYDTERQRCCEKQRNSFGEIVVCTILPVKHSQRLGNVEVEEAQRRQGPDPVIESVRRDGTCKDSRPDTVSSSSSGDLQGAKVESWSMHAGKKQLCSSCGTYPQNKISRTNTYRCRFVACHSVGTYTDTQIRALVGRRMHASAASSNDRRNLHDVSLDWQLNGTTWKIPRKFAAYFAGEPRCFSTICD